MDIEPAPQVNHMRSVKGTRKRHLTDDRRRQNREAQRRYQRRKGALEHFQYDGDSWGVLEAAYPIDSNTQQHTPISDRFTFQDNLIESSGEHDPDESCFFDDVLLLEPPSTAQERASPSLGIASPLPSPYRNHLSLQNLSFRAAYIQNALYMGLPLVLAQQEDDISPWYWHTHFAALVSQELHFDATCTPDSATSSYQFYIQRPVRRQPCFSLLNNIIPELSPTTLQRSRPHGMYLDMIPFPVFRDRAIMLLSMDPPAFDESELKRDIDSEGLLVWGVGHGSIHRTASLVRDKRNWECAKWFYKKWKLLIDGSGLDEQSKWWRAMRGEEESEPDR